LVLICIGQLLGADYRPTVPYRCISSNNYHHHPAPWHSWLLL